MNEERGKLLAQHNGRKERNERLAAATRSLPFLLSLPPLSLFCLCPFFPRSLLLQNTYLVALHFLSPPPLSRKNPNPHLLHLFPRIRVNAAVASLDDTLAPVVGELLDVLGLDRVHLRARKDEVARNVEDVLGVVVLARRGGDDVAADLKNKKGRRRMEEGEEKVTPREREREKETK